MQATLDNKRVFTLQQWLRIVNDNSYLKEDAPTLMHSVKRGLPPNLRYSIWVNYSKLFLPERCCTREYYNDMAERQSVWDDQIIKDLHRTFPGNPFFKNQRWDAKNRMHR